VKIAVFSHYFSPEIGAPSARIFDMAQQWIKLGHEVEVVTCFPNHPTGELYPGYRQEKYRTEILEGIKVHRSWTYITPNRGIIKKTVGHLTFLISSRMHSIPRLTEPDITIGTSPTFFAAMSAATAGHRYKAPFFMEVRDLWPACFVELGVLKNKFLIKLLEKWELALYRRADRVITVTEAFRQNLISRRIPAGKVCNIPNGADEDYWKPQSTPPSLARSLGINEAFTVLYIGAHGISQALSKVLDAARILNFGPNIQFVFVGEGAEKEKLINQARQQQLNNVFFFNSVNKEQVRKFYAVADVCLVPLRDISLFQSFIPSKMFEMMAMEKPIIASVRGEAAIILEESKGALVVPPEDSKAIANAILKIYQDPSLKQEMGEAGRAHVIANYSRRALAVKYLDLMNEEISKRK